MADRDDILETIHGLLRNDEHANIWAAALADHIAEKSGIHLHGITPVVLAPGDKVLVALDRADLNAAELQQLKAAFAERFPEVEFTLLAGVESVTVQQRKEAGDA